MFGMRLLPALSGLLLALVVACARPPDAPPTATTAPAAAAKPTTAAAAPTTAAAAPTTAPAAAPTTVAAAKPTTAAAPAATTAAAPAAKGGEIVIGKDQEAPGLDPAKNPASAAIRVFDLTYSRLTRLDTQMRPQPDLAEKWDISPDGKTYTFHLRKGVKFHNGRELTATDVKYTYERIINPETASIAKSFFDPIDRHRSH